MADVSPPPVPGSDASRGGPRDSERGQLFLVGALALSVILVTLAVLLNTAIYTGNVATRDPGTGSADVIEYRTGANEMAERTLTGVNYHNNTSYAALKSNFTESVGNWSVAATKHSVVKGTDAYAEVKSTTKGTRILQHGDRNFSNAAGDTDWTLANDVQVRQFTLTVDKSTVSGSSSDNFHIEVHDPDSSIYWKLSVYKTDPEIWIAVDKVDGSANRLGECSTTDDTTLNLTNSSFGGSDCDALKFWGAIDGRYDIRYNNGDDTNGSYSLVVDKETSAFDSPDYNSDAGPSPYVTPALYSAKVEVVYRSPTVDYRTQFRVAPGEYDG